MTRRSGPDVGVAQRVRERAVPAGALAEHAAAPGTPTPEALLDSWQHFLQQEVLPGTHRSRVVFLVPAQPRKQIGKGDAHGWHVLFADQAVEPFRQIFSEADPIRMGQAAAREAD